MLFVALLISITGWGIAGIFAGRAARQTAQLSLLFWGPIITFPLILVPLVVGISPDPSLALLLPAAASSLALFSAWAFYIAALQAGETSPVVAIGSAYPLFALVLFLVAGAHIPEASGLLGVVFVVLGLALLQDMGQGGISRKALLLGLGSAFLWGFWGFFDYQALQAGTAWDLMFWTFVFALSIALLFGLQLVLRRGAAAISINRESVAYRMAASFSSTIAVLAFYWALENASNPTAVISVTAAYPLVTMMLAVLLREENFYPRRLLSIALVVLGIIALHL